MDLKKIVSPLLKYGIPIAISVGLAWFLYKNVDLAAIGQSLSQDVDYWWFAPVIMVSTLSHVLRALRWRLQLRAIGIEPPLHAVVCSIFGTYFVNLLFPRLGEVWRTGYIAQREHASFSLVFGSLVGDRLSDTVTVLVLTLVTFFMAQDAFVKFLSHNGGESTSTVLMAGMAVACALGVALLIWLYRTKSSNGLVRKLQGIVRDLWQGLASIGHMRGKWWFLLYTMLIWLCYYMQLFIASKAFTFTCHLGWLPVLVLFVLSSIGMAVPSNGGLGPWQFAIIFGLTLYGVGAFPPSVPYDAQASAFAWLVWGVQTMLLIVLGIYAFAYIALDRRPPHSATTTATQGSTTTD